ncbi:UNVERIFIED_CONTAM: YD repeat-containing protein [Acetivibrio alkalicellulosi]
MVSLRNERWLPFGSTSLSRYSFEYYLDGNQSKKVEYISGNSTEYIYDGLGRLYRETDKENNSILTDIIY